MALSVVRGLILREVNIGEADKILTILVKDVGKISVSAKGARRTRGVLTAGTSLFTYADFTVKTGTKHHFLVQADIIDSFYSITKDLLTLSAASCMLELADKTTSENLPANETLFLTISILKRLAEGKISPQLALPLYELKILQYSGFMPRLDLCVGCGREHNMIMSPAGTLCSTCAKSNVRLTPVTPALVYTMQYILAYEPPALLGFELKDELLPTLAKITNDMIDTHFGIELKSKKFLKSLNIY